MDDNNLEKWIAELQENADPEKAYINFFIYGGAGDESAIRANRDGLLLFARRLIKVATELDKIDEGQSVAFNDEYAEWIDSKSDIWFQYVQKVNGYSEVENDETWQERVKRYFYAALFIGGIGVFLLGLWTLVNFFR